MHCSSSYFKNYIISGHTVPMKQSENRELISSRQRSSPWQMLEITRQDTKCFPKNYPCSKSKWENVNNAFYVEKLICCISSYIYYRVLLILISCTNCGCVEVELHEWKQLFTKTNSRKNLPPTIRIAVDRISIKGKKFMLNTIINWWIQYFLNSYNRRHESLNME